MKKEIEKKYKLECDVDFLSFITFLSLNQKPLYIEQCYLDKSKENTVRIRFIDNKIAIKTIKGESSFNNGFLERTEEEYEIDYNEAKKITKNLPLLKKERFILFDDNKFKIELDVFRNLKESLIIVETEVKKEYINTYNFSEKKFYNKLLKIFNNLIPTFFKISKTDFKLIDVTKDYKYSNSNLIENLKSEKEIKSLKR